jgi:hypothetical protein
MLLLRGDLLGALAAPDAALPPDADAAYRAGLETARRIGARGSELRVLTRLVRSAPPDAAAAWRSDLSAVVGSFTEGHRLPDMVAAREALSPPAST